MVGLSAEARLASRIAAPELIAASGATAPGARAAVSRLVANGATHLLSFGFAAGLDPILAAGAVLLPEIVMVDGEAFATDPALSAWFAGQAGPGSTVIAPLLHSDRLVVDRLDKAALFRASGCASLDMESGAVAMAARDAGLVFAVLRTVCDPAGTTLPPAARIALRPDGSVNRSGVLRSILRRPEQLPALIRLGRDMRAAQQALRSCLDRVPPLLTDAV